MLRLKLIQDSFKLYYKGKLFFEHDKDHPLIKLGNGKAQYQMNHGKFSINQDIIEVFPLTEFKVIKQTKTKVKITFSKTDLHLDLILEEKHDLLYISFENNNSELNRIWIKISANSNEYIYGCGAQFTKFNLRGHSIPLWVEESNPLWKEDFTTYFPQPSYISVNKSFDNTYFLFVETTYFSKFNFVNDKFHELEIWNIPENLIIGKYSELTEILKNLTSYLGRQPTLPDWVYDGLILAIQGGSEEVKKKLNIAKKHKIPVTGIWIQDWEGRRITSFGKQLFWNWKYDDNSYPNLPDLIKTLKQKGIKVLGYINPFLAIEGDLYEEASKEGYCVKNSEGKDYMIVTTDFPSALLDLTNPECIKWIKKIISHNIIEIGLSGYMADYGEYLPPDAVLYSGISGEEFHNQYPVIWAKVQYEILKESKNLEKILYFHRSNFSHGSKYTMLYWAGDQSVDWSQRSGLPSVINCGMSLGLSGIGNYSFDIGGFLTTDEIKRGKEVFMRWIELGAFSLIMRTHEGNRPDDNFQFDSDEEILEHLRKMVLIHVKLKPYLKNLEKEFQEFGVPPMRPCFLHYKDPNLLNLKYQYLLGRDLLIAPAIYPKLEETELYLPEDNWIHLWSSKEYQKGKLKIQSPIGKTAVFYRKDSKYVKIFKELAKLN